MLDQNDFIAIRDKIVELLQRLFDWFKEKVDELYAGE